MSCSRIIVLTVQELREAGLSKNVQIQAVLRPKHNLRQLTPTVQLLSQHRADLDLQLLLLITTMSRQQVRTADGTGQFLRAVCFLELKVLCFLACRLKCSPF